MKYTSQVFLFVLVLVFCTAVIAQGAGCVGGSGQRDDGIFYTDCFPWVSGHGMIPTTSIQNDTTRLQAAIYAARGGKLIFNEAVYYINGTLTLYTYSTLEGLTPESDYLDLRLIQTADNTSVFFIGEGIHDISIRDLGFYYDGIGEGNTDPNVTDATAIKAEGDPANSHSTYFQFEHLRIRNFTRGLYVHSTGAGGWQFDNNQLKDVSIEACDTGIELDATNTGWNMNNIVFASDAEQNGLYIKKAGYINLNLLVGNGARGHKDVPASGDFIKIEAHGFVNIQNANGEAYKRTLSIDTPNQSKSFPIVLMNNDFQNCPYLVSGVLTQGVTINNATVVSQGNSYACGGQVSRPLVTGWSDIYSTGDRFCYDGTTTCFNHYAPFDESTRGGWDLRGNLAVLRTDATADWVVDGGNLFPDMAKAIVDITTTYDNTETQIKPMLSLTRSYYDALYAPYYYKYRYTFSRNDTNGRLEMNGDLNGAAVNPLVGYHFKGGPVQLQTTLAANLTYYSLPGGDKGSMMYCSDCTAGTNPCSTAGGGGGALAIRIESGNWACK